MALLCVTLCAGSGVFLVTAGAVLSDMSFLAFSITAFYLADLEGKQKAAGIGAAVFAGLALLTRSVGVAVAAGIAAAFLYQQSYRKALQFAVGVLPFMAFAVALKLVSAAPVPGGITPGFRQTWLYYTSYAGFWRLSVPDLDALLAPLQANLVHLFSTPAALCLGPPPPGSLVGILLFIAVSGVAECGPMTANRALRDEEHEEGHERQETCADGANRNRVTWPQAAGKPAGRVSGLLP